MEAQPREIQNYLTADGRSPFEEWLDSLKDTKARDKSTQSQDIRKAKRYWRDYERRENANK